MYTGSSIWLSISLYDSPGQIYSTCVVLINKQGLLDQLPMGRTGKKSQWTITNQSTKLDYILIQLLNQ